MAGLLDVLDSLLGDGTLASSIGDRVTEFSDISGSVAGLTDGPVELGNLQGLIDGLPLSPDLSRLGTLSSSLADFSAPTDFSTALAPILSPLTTVADSITGGSVTQFTALFDLIREITKLASGQQIGGPGGMPEGMEFEPPQLPPIEEIHEWFGRVHELLDTMGPRLDAVKIFHLLKEASSHYTSPRFDIPGLPIVDDTLEALSTVAAWQNMTGPQIVGHITKTMNLATQLIRTPLDRVVNPYVSAAQTIAEGRNTLGATNQKITTLFVALRPKIDQGNAKPSVSQLCIIEEAAEYLDRMAKALSAEKSPLHRYESLSEDATRTLLNVVRTLQPAYDMSALAQSLRDKLAEVPEAPADMFNQIVTTINDFDLSSVTGPLQTVKNTVQGAVDDVNEAKESVREALDALLNPVAEGLDNAISAVGLVELQEALEGLPDEISNFVDDTIRPAIEPIKNSITTAVNTVSSTVDAFDPQSLIEPIRTVVEQAADLLHTDELRSTFSALDDTLGTAIQALENFNLEGAADESVSLMEGIEDVVEDIDPALIPDAVKPTIEQAVTVVTDIDFTGDVAEPIVSQVQSALEEGPADILRSLEENMDQLISRLEGFRPSEVVGDTLDEPFQELLATLREFKPSDLLNQLQQTMDSLKDRINVLDVDSVIDPMVEVYTTVNETVQSFQPSILLQPVQDAIDAAIEKVYEVTHIDSIFDGITDVLDMINNWIALLEDAHLFFDKAAGMLENPSDSSTMIQTFVNEVLSKIDSLAFDPLTTVFTNVSEAAQVIDRNSIASQLARASQTAGSEVPPLLISAELAQFRRLIEAFPIEQLRNQRKIPSRQRFLVAFDSIVTSLESIDSSVPWWQDHAENLTRKAGEIQEELLDYNNALASLNGNVLQGFVEPPQNSTALKEMIADAVTDSVQEPFTTLITAFEAFAPYIKILARGIGDMLDATHAKTDSMTGDDGLSGAVEAIEEAANLLRDIDLSIITEPLDTLYSRIDTAVGALNPEPLRAILESMRAAIDEMLTLASFLSDEEIQTIDNTYANALKKIEELSPGNLLAQTLDPVYEDLLADILPVLGMPKRLRELVETAGATLGDDTVRNIERVEIAFDEMLRAIPVSTGTQSASASASISVG